MECDGCGRTKKRLSQIDGEDCWVCEDCKKKCAAFGTGWMIFKKMKIPYVLFLGKRESKKGRSSGVSPYHAGTW